MLLIRFRGLQARLSPFLGKEDYDDDGERSGVAKFQSGRLGKCILPLLARISTGKEESRKEEPEATCGPQPK